MTVGIYDETLNVAVLKGGGEEDESLWAHPEPWWQRDIDRMDRSSTQTDVQLPWIDQQRCV
jgi:hypothetical protein